jgi:hypothetical protein
MTRRVGGGAQTVRTEQRRHGPTRGRPAAEPVPGGAGPDARAIATATLRADCDRLAAVTFSGHDPAMLSAEAYGIPANADQSTLALLGGVQFERGLTREECAAMRALLVERGVLTEHEAGAADVLNVEAHVPGTSPTALSERERLTRHVLSMKLAGASDAPTLVYHPRLRLRVGEQSVAIVPDFLIASRRDRQYRPGEAKAFRDRGTVLTNTSALRMARLQAAVEVLALQDTVVSVASEVADGVLDATVSDAVPPARFELVLRSRVSSQPSLRRQAIPHEVEAVRGLLRHASRRVREALARIPAGVDLATREGLDAIPHRFTPECRGHCGLAAACEAQGWARGEPAVLGPTFERAMGVVGSIPRLLELLGGAAPASDEERRTLRAFARSYARLEREGVVDGADAIGRELRRMPRAG